MSKIRGKDTKIEVKVRKHLFSQGFRFRKNDKKLAGKPDIVLPKYKTVIFIHGCFWHRHENCKDATTPKTRVDFWEEKFSKNIENDKKNCELLMREGWQVIVLWECEIEKHFEETMAKTILKIRSVEVAESKKHNA